MKINKYYKYLFTAIVIILIYILIFPITGKMRVHDNLDSNIAWTRMYFEGQRFMPLLNGNNHLPLSGISRYLHINPFNYLFAFFGYYYGIIIAKLIMAFVAFYGMFLLLKKHFIQNCRDYTILFGVPLCFALLPFWSYTLSVAGLPLLILAILNIRDSSYTISDFVILIAYPFLGSLILTGIFLLLAFTILLVYDFLSDKQKAKRLFTALIVVSIFFIISNYQLFFSFFIEKAFVSHRTQFSGSISLVSSLKRTYRGFIEGHYRHAASLHSYAIFPVIAVSFIIAIIAKISKNIKLSIFTQLLNKRIVSISSYIIIASFIYGFEWYKGFTRCIEFLTNYIPINLYRFVFINTPLWYILFAVVLSIWVNYKNKFRYIILLLIIIQIAFSFYNHESLYTRIKNHPRVDYFSFFAKEQFNDIKKSIPEDPENYAVISLGLYPSVAQYNGFYTFDGYYVNYPLSHKKLMAKVLKNEFKKDKSHKKYFSNRGTRCYILIKELPYRRSMYLKHYFKGNKKKIDEPDLDYQLLSSHNVRYIFSAVEINRESLKNLIFEGKYTHADSLWDIYLYQINTLSNEI